MASLFTALLLLLPLLRDVASQLVLNSSAELAVVDISGLFTGASGSMNVWQPYVELENEYSASQIMLTSESGANIIELGWHVWNSDMSVKKLPLYAQVYPLLYGDNETHVFVRWTIVQEGGYRIGCFNTVCSGFVQVSTALLPGTSISDTISEVNGTQFITSFSIQQSDVGDWWVANNNEVIGYFPASLLKDLREGAAVISFGGKILNKRNQERHTYTEMGSGFFPLSGLGFSAYHSNMTYTDFQNNFTTRIIADGAMSLVNENTGDCYFTYFESPTGRLFYGGAGDNPRCQGPE